MKYKENKDSTGVLRGYWDENGKACFLSEPFEEDGLTLKPQNIIIPADESEVAKSLEAVKKLEELEIATQYKRDRASEYPDFREYLDGIVKNDQEQINAYIAACQAVKYKYPKP